MEGLDPHLAQRVRLANLTSGMVVVVGTAATAGAVLSGLHSAAVILGIGVAAFALIPILNARGLTSLGRALPPWIATADVTAAAWVDGSGAGLELFVPLIATSAVTLYFPSERWKRAVAVALPTVALMALALQGTPSATPGARGFFLVAAMMLGLGVVGALAREKDAAIEEQRALALDLQREIARREAAASALRELAEQRAVGDLAGGLAHETNTPLQVVSDGVTFFEDVLTAIKASEPAPGAEEARLEALCTGGEAVVRLRTVVPEIRAIANELHDGLGEP